MSTVCDSITWKRSRSSTAADRAIWPPAESPARQVLPVRVKVCTRFATTSTTPSAVPNGISG